MKIDFNISTISNEELNPVLINSTGDISNASLRLKDKKFARVYI